MQLLKIATEAFREICVGDTDAILVPGAQAKGTAEIKTVKTVNLANEAAAETLDPEVAGLNGDVVVAAKKEVTLETLNDEVVAAKNEVAELKLMIVQVLRKLRAMSSVTSSSHSDQSAFLKVDIPAPGDE